MPQHQSGIIFFAHGSRDPLWRKPIEAVAQTLLQKYPQSMCCCAYLELNTPDLLTACDGLIQQGCTRITVLPMFLGTGRHARQDLPALIRKLQKSYPAVQFEIATTVGEDPRVIELLAALAAQYIA